MLTTQGETSEASILERISMARGNAEPAPAEPTEELEAVNVSEEAPEEVESEEVLEPEVSDEAEPEEEEEVSELSSTESDDDEDLFVEYKGREINLKDIEEWEQGNLRQSDYTRKTQELADKRKAFEDEQEGFNAERQKLTAQTAALEAIISEELLSADDVAEMREYDPEAYIKYQEKMGRMKSALADAKTQAPKGPSVDVEAERTKLWANNPKWGEAGKPSPEFKQDMDMLNEYAAKSGYSNEEIQAITSSHHWETLLKAARYEKLSQKNSSLAKKVRKAPVSTKPRQAAQSSLEAEIAKADARFRKSGKDKDALALMKLQRKRKG